MQNILNGETKYISFYQFSYSKISLSIYMIFDISYYICSSVCWYMCLQISPIPHQSNPDSIAGQIHQELHFGIVELYFSLFDVTTCCILENNAAAGYNNNPINTNHYDNSFLTTLINMPHGSCWSFQLNFLITISGINV